MRKRIISLIITIGLVATIGMQVMANPLSDKLSNQKSKLVIQKNAYKKAQSNIDNIEISIEELDSNIENMYAQVDKTKLKVADTQKRIDKTTKDIQVAQDNIKEEQTLYNARMRSMYMNGVDSYVEVLLDSKGIEDFISRAETVKTIVQYDNKIIAELTAKKSEVQSQKVSLETEKTKLLSLKADNEAKLEKLKDTKKDQSVLILEATKQEKLYSGKINDGQATVAATMKQIQQIRDNASNTTLSRGGSASFSSNAVVAYACNFLGTPYVWGANGPQFFDCSGFMQYVYAHFGVSLSRTTYTQINEGTYVARGDLQPGDLIFFGTQSNPHHVGMYVGNNSYIQAPRTGDVIKISALTRSDYLTARRVR